LFQLYFQFVSLAFDYQKEGMVYGMDSRNIFFPELVVH